MTKWKNVEGPKLIPEERLIISQQPQSCNHLKQQTAFVLKGRT